MAVRPSLIPAVGGWPRRPRTGRRQSARAEREPARAAAGGALIHKESNSATTALQMWIDCTVHVFRAGDRSFRVSVAARYRPIHVARMWHAPAARTRHAFQWAAFDSTPSSPPVAGDLHPHRRGYAHVRCAGTRGASCSTGSGRKRWIEVPRPGQGPTHTPGPPTSSTSSATTSPRTTTPASTPGARHRLERPSLGQT